MKDIEKAEETAINKFIAITPLVAALEENADKARFVLLKEEASEKSGVHRRTLERWLAAYQQHGLEGLKPAGRSGGKPGCIPEELIEEAILIRREVPSRSISQIIEILEMEGKAVPGLIKRTTLQDKLKERGYSARQMKMYRQGGLAARRFARLERGDMWHSDIKYGDFLTIDGEKKQTFLVVFLDDATRYVVHGEFYDSLDQSIVEDCFRKSILKEGVPRRVYFDQGGQYRNKWMQRACAILGIRLIYAKPYSPESTGKVERFNRTVEGFMDEAALTDCRTLEEYNKLFTVWITECYHTRGHGGLGGEITPETAYKSSKTPLRFESPEVIASAFMRMETRKVDKSGCISFKSKKYEVGVLLAGRRVDVVYDASDIGTLTVEYDGDSWKVNELRIGEHTGPRPKLPKSMLPALPPNSRLLIAKERKYADRQDDVRRAIRYDGMGGGDCNV